MTRYTVTVGVECPTCQETVEVELAVTHDPGCWRTKNGDGWPESWSYDVISEKCEECGTAVTEKWDAAIEAAFQEREDPPEPDWESDAIGKEDYP